jgi:tetratricopeptide (TPR) repeat protein
LRLKGKREPVAAYELVGLRTPGATRIGAGEEAPLIGRDAEVGSIIGRLLEVVDSRRPASLLVTGEAGLGKTRLAQELTRFAGDLPAARVLWSRCAPYGVGRDLSPLVELVQNACGITPEDEPDAATARVVRTLARLDHPAASGRAALGLEERLLALLGLGEDGDGAAALPAATPGEATRSTAELDAVSALLRALAGRGPLVLVVDDLQWASDSTLRALAGLFGQLAGAVFVVGLGRTELLSRGSWWRALPRAEVLPLGPLDDSAAERLLRAYLHGADLIGEVRDDLLDRAQGNPFFLAELLHLLVDRGLLRMEEGGGWTLQGAVPADVLPAGVQAVLAARIDSLDATAKAVLRDAAVLGLRVPLAALEELAAAEREQVHGAVDALLARGLLIPAPGHAAGADSRSAAYVFGHALARDVAYASIPKSERAHRHALAARWAATALPEGTEADQVLATHAARAAELAEEMALPADDPAWAVRSLGFAAYARLGHAAAASDDNRAAERLLVAGLTLGSAVASEEQILPVRVALAQSLSAQWRPDEAEQMLAPALDWDDAGVRASALAVLGDLRRKQGRDAEATQAWVSALSAAADAGLDRIAGEVLRNLGLQDYLAGRLRAADERFREALSLARRVGDARGAGWALQHLAWGATTRGDYDEADQCLSDAAAVFAALEDTGGLAWCSGTEAFVRVLQGRLHEARDLIEGLLPAAEDLSDTWAVAACLTIDALAAAELGMISDAEQAGARAETLFASLDDRWGASLALVAQASAARGGGHLARAVELFSHAEEVAAAAANSMNSALAATMLGFTQLDAGDITEAERAAERAQAALGSQDLEPAATVGLRVLCAVVLRAKGDAEGGLELLRACAELLDGHTLLFPRRQAYAQLAAAQVALGRGDEAVATAERALAVPAEDVRSQVVALRVLGDALRLTGDKEGARTAYARALDVATSTEQVSERSRTEQALAAL